MQLKTFLSNTKNNKFILQLLSEILKMEIIDIKSGDIKELNKISEYDFSLIKISAILKDNKDADIYLKLIKKGTIKQSLFCYWSLLYEDELKENDINKSITKINKVLITEFEEDEYKNSVFLEIENNNTELLKYGTEVHFVDIAKYINSNKYKLSNVELQDDLTNNLLFIGVLKNA